MGVCALIRICIEKAKKVAHDRRRAKRAELFSPLDVQATIPSQATKAEQERQKIRDKDASVQSQIDAATTAQGLKAILDTL